MFPFYTSLPVQYLQTLPWLNPFRLTTLTVVAPQIPPPSHLEMSRSMRAKGPQTSQRRSKSLCAQASCIS
ncbi:uncharacterized protein ARMOST_18225 [Armillaria ostoyae]|uniref:Uncharacterized protein n=1 Tax=Armillaria ostoyae TaxID=47428 RepID=A0A284S194_ARMOS|nr:uncharacterized protein ARMOST_18225 [Armillaria ostoyae]